ncbi:MAG: TerB family tellurite resistance protein [SAR324 cluster bacterium]|nr:TerB family tellurite resistance protein [SAR324 cluster bacterium]
MLDKVKELLSAKKGSWEQSGGKPELQVAVCALLLEMAHVDYDYHPAERDTIIALLQERFALSGEDTAELMQIAEAGRVKFPELAPFIYVINAAYSSEDKRDLLVMLWQVILADERFDSYEELLMRKLGPMLEVDQATIEEVRQLALDDVEK